MTALTIAQASLTLGVAQDTVRKRIKSGEIPATKERCAGGFRWMVDVTSRANGSTKEITGEEPPLPSGSDPGDSNTLVEVMKAQIAHLQEELTVRAGEIDQLHRLLAQTALNAAPARPWWQFWRG